MRLWTAALRLLAAYLIGMIGIGLLMSLMAGHLAAAALFAVGGTIVALPLRIVAVATLAIVRTHVQAHLARWCVVAPVAVGMAQLILFRIVSRDGVAELFATDDLAAEVGFAGLSAVGAAIASLAFYLMQGDRT